MNLGSIDMPKQREQSVASITDEKFSPSKNEFDEAVA